jgi:hypothetical protein
MKARDDLGVERAGGLAARAAVATATVLAIALLAIACTSILGVSDVELPADACIADGDTSDPCYLCEDQSCCPQYLSSQQSSEYTTYEASLKACVSAGASSSQCVLQCAAQNPAGHAVSAPLLACVTYHCFAACAMGQDNPCAACLQASCADLAYACDSNPDCDVLDNCIDSCDNAGSNIPNCIAVCKNNAPSAAQQLYQPLYACQIKYCATACATSDSGSSGGSGETSGSSSSGGSGGSGGSSGSSCSNPVATTMCTAGSLSCDASGHCCPSSTPYGCVASLQCYALESSAVAACGSACIVCGGP